MFTIVILFSIFHVYIYFQLPRYGALVFIDECHATGFLGETGRGTEEYFGMKGQVDIINSTLGKALGGILSLYPCTNYAVCLHLFALFIGAAGGYTTASKQIIDLLRQRARPYLFSNSLPPAVVATASQVGRLF